MTMASAQKSFHLRWNNHLQNLQNLFENLYNEQSLVDVTLSCSDGMLYGHKLVLSACSPYFERVLRDNPCKHPIMILKGIRQSDMQKLLEYMYVGAIDVIEDDLEKLLDTATELQIKGLATSQRKNTERRSVPVNQLKCKARSPSPKQHTAPEDKKWEVKAVLNDPGPNNDASNEICNVKVDPDSNEETDGNSEQIKSNQRREKDQQNQGSLKNEFNLNIIKEEFIDNNSVDSCEKGFGPVESIDDSYDEQIDQMENVEMNLDNSDLLKPSEFTGHSVDMPYFCHLCSRGFDKKGSLQRHMLTHAGVKPHNCNFCDLSFLRLSHLQRHIRVHTGERPYACAKCPKQFSRSDKLRQHNILTHNESNIRASKPRGRPRKLVGYDGFSYPFVAQPVVSVPVVKGKRPRGRPRKHPEFYPPAPPPPSTSFADVPLNTLYPVTISPIQLNSTI